MKVLCYNGRILFLGGEGFRTQLHNSTNRLVNFKKANKVVYLFLKDVPCTSNRLKKLAKDS